MNFHALARRQDLAFFSARSIIKRRHVRWRIWRWRSHQSGHHPFASLYRRGSAGIGGQNLNAALTENSTPGSIRILDPSKVRTGHVWNAVVPRQSFIDESVVGAE